MQYFSTNRTSPVVDFRGAVLAGQPDDRGLFFPESIPQLSGELLGSLEEMTQDEIAFEVIRPFVGDAIDADDLRDICRETVDLPFPLVPVTDRIYSLELFHGPTLAFKDVGARFMSRCLRIFSKERGRKTLVIVATSGDTGGAVAAGFHGAENVEVVILYPSGKVSRLQELQLTTLGGNITAIEVAGVFDDCQRIAKDCLLDKDIKDAAFTTSANSINIARWLSQQFYYFFAVKALPPGTRPVVSVPSGNFGNICAGLLARASGLKIGRFIAACNANSAVTDYLSSGIYTPQPTKPTLSNAMDVGDPSNFARFGELFARELSSMRAAVHSASVTDDETREVLASVHRDLGYVLDPHGAVAFKVLRDYLGSRPDEIGVFLETAHPLKFDSVEQTLGVKLEVPAALQDLFQKEKNAVQCPPDLEAVKKVILDRI